MIKCNNVERLIAPETNLVLPCSFTWFCWGPQQSEDQKHVPILCPTMYSINVFWWRDWCAKRISYCITPYHIASCQTMSYHCTLSYHIRSQYVSKFQFIWYCMGSHHFSIHFSIHAPFIITMFIFIIINVLPWFRITHRFSPGRLCTKLGTVIQNVNCLKQQHEPTMPTNLSWLNGNCRSLWVNDS